MTQEEKDILLKDLCARIPYGVRMKVLYPVNGIELEYYLTSIYKDNVQVNTNNGGVMAAAIDAFKPYLRPMSSMTEEEKNEMHELLSPKGTAVYRHDGISTPVSHFGDFIPYEYMSRVIAWLAKNQFDYNGLIPMGLAIELIKE